MALGEEGNGPSSQDLVDRPNCRGNVLGLPRAGNSSRVHEITSSVFNAVNGFLEKGGDDANGIG